jgi:transposase
MIALDSLPAEARQAFKDLQAKADGLAGLPAEVARLQQIIEIQDQKIRLLNFQLWGPKGETISPAQTSMLFEEASVTSAEIEKEAELPPAQKENPRPGDRQPRAHHPGREKLPEQLERREVVIPCPPQDCLCGQCGAERPVIGYEKSEELVCDPATFWVRVNLREKRGSHCVAEQGVATAPTPAKIVPKSKLSNEFIIEALAKKFQQHQPVYRQCAVLAENHGIELSRATLTSAILAAGDLLRAVVRAQADELRKTSYLQADETPVPVQTGEKPGRNHKAYMWEYSRPAGPVVFDFQMGRGREGPAAFLKGFGGILQCDGYAAYDKLGEDIRFAGCLAHARRGFVEANKLAPQNPLPVEIVDTMGRLYAVEEKARQAGLGAAERLALRQEHSAPVMEALKLRLAEIRQQIPPGGRLAEACDYTLNQWSRLEVFLKNGEVEIDNNFCYAAHGITPVMPPPDLCRVAA